MSRACIRCSRFAYFCAEHAAEMQREKDDTIRDLRARLKAVRAAEGQSAKRGAWPLDALVRIRNITDLRVRNWRKL